MQAINKELYKNLIYNSNYIRDNVNLTPLQKIYSVNNKITPLIAIITSIFTLSLIIIAFIFRIELYVFLITLALPLIWLMIHYPRLWIYSIVLTFTIFMREGDTEVNALHIFAGVFYNSFLIIWFLYKLIIKKENLIRNFSDQLFLFFCIVLIFNAAIAIGNDVNWFDWLREYLSYSLILYYFPIREYFKEPKHIIKLVFLIGLVTICLDLIQFYNYIKILKNIIYAYQFSNSMRINQHIFSAVGFSGIAFFFYFKSIRGKLFSFIVTVLSISALISTLSRAFWVALLAMIMIFLFYLSKKQLIQLISLFIIFLGIAVFSLNTFMPDKANIFYKYLGQRFSSTGQGKKDISIRSRLYEFKKVNSLIEESPIWGHGLRYEFSFFENIKQATKKTSFVHNGYLNIAYKTGIPLTIAFYLPLLLYLIQGFLISIRTSSYLHRIISICAFLTLLMLFVTNFVTSSFLFRDGLMTTAISIAFISISLEYYKNNEIPKKLKILC